MWHRLEPVLTVIPRYNLDSMKKEYDFAKLKAVKNPYPAKPLP
jgi:hypothetical protein